MLFAIQLFMAVAGTLTLLVGAVGVMNIMLVVVTSGRARSACARRSARATATCSCSSCSRPWWWRSARACSARRAASALLQATAPVFERAGIAVGARPDPFTTALVSVALVAVAIVAGVLPARAPRASRRPRRCARTERCGGTR